MIPVPEFVRLEQWSPKKKEWVVLHAGVNLLHPDKYVERYEKNGKIARAIGVETGEIWGPAEDPEPSAEPLACVLCGEPHVHGMCLI